MVISVTCSESSCFVSASVRSATSDKYLSRVAFFVCPSLSMVFSTNVFIAASNSCMFSRLLKFSIELSLFMSRFIPLSSIILSPKEYASVSSKSEIKPFIISTNEFIFCAVAFVTPSSSAVKLQAATS